MRANKEVNSIWVKHLVNNVFKNILFSNIYNTDVVD